jgi:uncharacterized membrane protein
MTPRFVGAGAALRRWRSTRGIAAAGRHVRALVDARYPPGRRVEDKITAADIIPARQAGVVQRIAHRRLVTAAEQAECTLELQPLVGDFVPAGAPLFRIHGLTRELSSAERRHIAGFVRLGSSRNSRGDPVGGVRKLAAIASAAASGSPPDPARAVHALDQLHDILRQLATRPFPSGEHRDASGQLRLTERVPGWDVYVRLAFGEIRLTGIRHQQICRRLAAALADLRDLAPPARRPPLERELRLLEAAARREYADPADATAALIPDLQGIGSGPDLAGGRWEERPLPPPRAREGTAEDFWGHGSSPEHRVG